MMTAFALTKILNKEREFNIQNLMRMKRAHDFKKRELIDKDGGLFLTVDSLIRINNIITNSHNLHLRHVNVKPAGYDNIIWKLTESRESCTFLLISSMIDLSLLGNFTVYFSIRYIRLQMGTVEHTKFCSLNS